MFLNEWHTCAWDGSERREIVAPKVVENPYVEDMYVKFDLYDMNVKGVV